MGGFWKKIGETVLGDDAMKVVDRMAEDRRQKEIENAKKVLERAGHKPSGPQTGSQTGPQTEVERAAYSAMNKLDAAKSSGQTASKAELIRAAQAIHRGKQSLLDDLDPKAKKDLQNLAKNVFGIKD